MRHHALEIYVIPEQREVTCFIASPTHGEAILRVNHACQRLTLNDGVNRVLVAVVGHPLSIDTIKRIAREALTA